MDELNSGFGSLSTSAAEWKPYGAASASEAAQGSDLNPEAVKEFVPGRAWNAEENGNAVRCSIQSF